MAALIELESSPSTNSEMVARAAELHPFDAIVTLDQTAGRGRAGRDWIAPPGTALAVSVLVPLDGIPTRSLGWIPLAAGLAMAETVAEELPERLVSLKWPNDVMVGDRKVCGVLAELLSNAAVVGAGLNLTMTAAELPVPTATSLALEGAAVGGLASRALDSYRSRVQALAEGLKRNEGDAERSGLAAAVRAHCSTIGRRVRVELPGGGELLGDATAIDADGRLVVAGTAVSAGDIVHLRAAPGSGAA